MNKVFNLLNQSEKCLDRRLSREFRVAALDGIDYFIKQAQTQQTGILQSFRDGIMEYPTRVNKQMERGGERSKELYPVSEHKKMDPETREHDRSLSTRYSPDRPGVQARRLADGVYQDPYTNKIYDWNEGFTTEDGQKFHGGSVELQSDLINR